MNNLDRIAKVIARRTGLSRRKAEGLIFDSRVKINGKVVLSPGEKISYQQAVYIDDLPIAPIEKTKIWLFHKPPKTLCSTQDEIGRKLIYDLLPEKYQNLKYVGRLDYMSEGLLLLTNDGELARYLTLPKNNISREYHVKIFGTFDEEDLRRKFTRKITIDGISFYIKDFAVLDNTASNSWISITLSEGKNREIRRIMEKFDLKISRLIRVSYGPYSLGTLKKGEIREMEVRFEEGDYEGNSRKI